MTDLFKILQALKSELKAISFEQNPENFENLMKAVVEESLKGRNGFTSFIGSTPKEERDALMLHLNDIGFYCIIEESHIKYNDAWMTLRWE